MLSYAYVYSLKICSLYLCVYILCSFLKLATLQSFQKHKLGITIAEVYWDFYKQSLRTPDSFEHKFYLGESQS